MQHVCRVHFICSVFACMRTYTYVCTHTHTLTHNPMLHGPLRHGHTMRLLQVNCRRVRDEPNVLEGLASQPLFLAILGLELGLQAAIVQAGGPVGRAFSTVPLGAPQWGLCVGAAGLTLLLRAALRSVQTEPPPPPLPPPPTQRQPPTAARGDAEQPYGGKTAAAAGGTSRLARLAFGVQLPKWSWRTAVQDGEQQQQPQQQQGRSIQQQHKRRRNQQPLLQPQQRRLVG
jgi:Cation transporting ATPase, C-terminus